MGGNIARWALRFLGLALGLGGGAAMLRGWDIVQVERGWSLFIAGAAALSGGSVVIALAEVVARLDRLLAGSARAAADATAKPAPVTQAPTPPAPIQTAPAPQAEQRAAPAPPPEPKTAPAPSEPSALQGQPDDHALEPRPEVRSPAPTPTALAPPAPLPLRREEAQAPEPIARARAQAAPPPVEEPREIERYQSGGLTYVMYSDGSVELRSETGAQRFSSIEELRAVLATQV